MTQTNYCKWCGCNYATIGESCESCNKVEDKWTLKRFKKGDVIIYQRFGPANVEFEKEKFVIVNLDEVLGVIK